MTDPGEILSALIDGEPVDNEALVEALSAPEASETLLAFARLRMAAAQDDAEPSPAVRAAIEAGLETSPRRWWRGRLQVPIPLAAAGIASAAGIAAILVARPGGQDAVTEDLPPHPELVVRFELTDEDTP